VIVSWECSPETCSFNGRPTHSKQVQTHKVRRKLEVESEDSLDNNDMESAGRRLPTQARIPQILINRKSRWTSLFATKILNNSMDPTLEGSDSSDF
jgi:hypothetical protein